MRTLHLVSLVVWLLAQSFVLRAQQPPGLEEKAARYHAMLLKRPKPGAIFERFASAWLESGTIDSLRKFLQDRASAAGATTEDRMILGFFLSQQNEHEAAVAAFAQALQNDAANDEAWLLRAQAETRMLDFTSALSSVSHVSAKAQGETAVDAAKLKARLLTRTGDTDKAIEVLRALAAAHPEDEDLQDDVVELLVEEGLHSDAVLTLSALIERTRDPYLKVMRRLRLGDIHQRANKRDEALATYALCLDDAAQDSWIEGEVIAQIEQLFRRKDDLNGLREKLDELARQHAQRLAVGLARVRVLQELGEEQAALDLHKGLLETHPGDARLQESYADMLAKARKFDEAAEVMRGLSAKSPRDQDMRMRLALLLHLAGKPGEAEKIVDASIAAADAGEGDYLRAARMYESFGEAGDARRVYQAATDKFPGSAAAKEVLATFYHAHDERQRAVALWKQLAGTGNKDEALRVARALSARGEHGAALDVLKTKVPAPPYDRAWLIQLVQAAVGAKEAMQARGWAQDLLAMASTPDEVEEALRVVRGVYRDADAGAQLLTELKNKSDLSVQQRCLLASLHEDTGDAARAEEILLAPVADGDRVLLMRQRARLFQRRQDYEKAAEVMQSLVALAGQKTPENVEILTTLLMQSRQPAEALKWIAEWKALQPGSTRPWLEEARALQQDNRESVAVEVLRAAVRKFDKDVAVAGALASAYSVAHQPADAQRIYTDLYEKADDSAGQIRWVASVAQMAQERNQLPELISQFQERQRSNRQSVMPWLALAEIHRVAGNYEARRSALLEAARLRPKDVDLLQQVARVEEGEGDWRRAVETLTEAAKLDKTTKCRERIAELQMLYGDEATGLRMLADLAGGARMEPRVAEAMALAAMQRGSYETALSILEPVVQRFADDYRLRMLMVFALLETNKQEQAIEGLLRVCGAQDEIPGIQAPAGSGERERQRRRRYVEFPPGVDALAPVAQSINRTNYRNYFAQTQQAQQRGPAGRGVQREIWILPASVEDAPAFAAGQLVVLSQDWPKEKRQELANRAREAGLDAFRVFVDFTPGPRGGLDLAQERIDEPFADITLAAWWLSDVLNGRSGSVEAERFASQLERARDLLAKDYPALASLACLKLWSEQPDKRAADAAQAAELLARVPPDHTLWLGSGAALLRGVPQAELQGPSGRKFIEAAVVWHKRRALANHDARSHAAWWTAFLYIMSRDWTAFVRTLEEETIEWQKNDAARAGLEMSLRSPGYAQIGPPRFPREALAELPEWVLGMAGSDFLKENKLTSAELDELRARVEALSDPLLRMYMSLACDQRARAEAIVRERAGAKDARFAELMMAAALADEAGDAAAEVALLVRARGLSNGLGDRYDVDSALVHAAARAMDDGKADAVKAVAETVRSAALSLRQLMAGSGKSDDLVVALRKLGMEDEAARLKKFAASSSARSRTGGSSQNQQASPDDFEELTKKGQVDAAVQMAVKTLRGMADQMLASAGGYYNLDDWIKRIEKAKLTDRVWLAAQPADQPGFKQKLQTALLGEMLGKVKEARVLMEQCVETRPRDGLLRFHLAGLMLRSGGRPEDAVEQIMKVERRDVQAAGQAWVNQVTSLPDLETRIQVADLCALFLQKMVQKRGMGAASEQTVWWTTTARDKLKESIYGDVRIPDLLEAGDKDSDRDGKKPDPALMQRRRQAFDRLSLAMMQHPLMGVAAFEQYGALVLRDGGDLQPLVAHARGCIERFAAELAARRDHPDWAERIAIAGMDDDDEQKLPTMTAPELLIYDAWKRADAASVERDLLPLISRAFGKGTADVFKAKAQLYFCAEKDFLAAVESWEKSLGARNRDRGTGSASREALRVRDARGLHVPAAPLVVGHLREQVKAGEWINHVALVQAMRAEALRGGQDAARALLEAVLDAYLGPADQRAELVARSAPRSDRESPPDGSPGWRVDQAASLLREAAQKRELALTVLLAARASGFEKTRYFKEISSTDFLDAMRNDGAGLWEFARQAGFLADMQDFDPIEAPGATRGSLFGGLIAELNRMRTDAKEQLAKFHELADAAQKQKPTFGAVLLATQSGAPGGYSFQMLKDWSVPFAALKPDQKRLAMLALDGAYAGLEARIDRLAGDTGRSIRGAQPFLDYANEQWAERLPGIMAARTLKEAGLEERADLMKLKSRLKVLKPEDATALVIKVGELLEDRERREGGRPDGLVVDGVGDGWPISCMWLEFLLQEASSMTVERYQTTHVDRMSYAVPGTPGEAVARVVVKVLCDPKQRVFGHSSKPGAFRLAQAVDDLIVRAGGLGDARAAAGKAADVFRDSLPQGGALVAMPALYDLLFAHQPRELRAMAKVWREDPTTAALGDAADVALTLGALQGFAGDPVWPQAAPSADQLSALDRALNWSGDARINPLLRLGFAACVLRECGPHADARLAALGMDLLCDAMERNEPTDKASVCGVLNAFNASPKDDAWMARASRFASVWTKRNADVEDAGEGTAFVPSEDTLLAALELFARMGDTARVERCLGAHSERLARRSGAALVLARHGLHKQAAAVIERVVDDMQGHSFGNELVFTKADAEALPKLVDSTRKPAVKAAARALLPSAIDPFVPAGSGYPAPIGSARRLAEAVPAILALGVEDVRRQDALAQIVNASPLASALMLDWHDKREAKLHLLDDPDRLDYEQMETAARFGLGRALTEALAGKPEAWADKLEQWRRSKNSENLMPQAAIFAWNQGRIWVRGQPEAAVANLADLSTVLLQSLPQERGGEGVLECLGLRTGAMAVANQSETKTWPDALRSASGRANAQPAAASGVLERVVFGFCMAGLDNEGLRAPDVRLRLVESLATQDSLLRAVTEKVWPRPLQMARRKGGISGAEIRSHASELYAKMKHPAILNEIIEAFDEVGDSDGLMAFLKAEVAGAKKGEVAPSPALQDAAAWLLDHGHEAPAREALATAAPPSPPQGHTMTWLGPPEKAAAAQAAFVLANSRSGLLRTALSKRLGVPLASPGQETRGTGR